MLNKILRISAVSLVCASTTAVAGMGDGNVNGFSGSGVFVRGGTYQTTIEAPIPGFVTLNAANESSSIASASVIRIDCVHAVEVGGPEYFISGYKVTNSRTSFNNTVTFSNNGNLSNQTFSLDNLSTLGDKMVGKFAVNGDGTISRSNWTNGLENCIGIGINAFGNNTTNPRTAKAFSDCTRDRSNWVSLPDCDDLTVDQKDSLILDRTTRAFDSFTYQP